MADVTLPQLGESVTEGIITTWLVEVGDTVEVDQPIVEISTDKVDTEIPSPVAGVVQELLASVDDEVEVGAVIARIGEDDGAGSGDDGAADDGDADADADDVAEGADDAAGDETDDGDADAEDHARVPDEEEDEGQADAAPKDGNKDETDAADDAGDAAADREPSNGATAGGEKASQQTPSGGGGVVTSPLVRKILREAGLSESDVTATGSGGRLTREDAERAVAAGGADGGAAAASSGSAVAASGGGQGRVVAPPPAHTATTASERPAPSPTQIDFGGERAVTQDLTRVRKAIARGMMDSLQNTAQLTAAVEVDMTAIMNLRAAVKDDFKRREGASLSPLPFVCRAVTMAIPRHPTVNSSMDLEGGTATFHRNVNLGMAVDTDRGLLVPNIKNAEDLTVTGIAKAIADLASRTRNKKIQPDDIQGATFTVTNTGSVGTLFDTPILNAPEVAILAACSIEKRPIVVTDAYGDSIAIRQMTYLCLSYDHRMLDGADAARFLQDVKWTLENHDFSSELGL